MLIGCKMVVNITTNKKALQGVTLKGLYLYGGARGARTPDLLSAIYVPEVSRFYCLVVFGCICYGKWAIQGQSFTVW